MADAYKVKKDVSLPKAIREVETLVGGETLYETEGRNYAAGQYVKAEDITPPLRKRADDGELDDFLEGVSGEEAKRAIEEVDRAERYSTFIPDHETEAQILEEYGHETVPEDQVLELKSAGADAAKDAIEAAKESGLDKRAIDTSTKEAVDVPEGTEQPPGIPVPAASGKKSSGGSRKSEGANKPESKKG